MVEGRISKVHKSEEKENALDIAVECAMENYYSYGRSDAADIIKDQGSLFIGDYSIHLASCEE